MLNISKVLTIATLLLASTGAHALDVISFESSANNFSEEQQHDGFTFFFKASGWFVANNSLSSGFSQNGTTRLIASGPRDGLEAGVLISRTDGSPFSFSQFDGATAITGRTDVMRIISTTAGNDTVESLINVSDQFSTFTLGSGYANLMSIRFSAITDPISNQAGIGLDNIVFGAASGGTNVVPEPGTWAMLIVGFGLVGVSARRRSRAVLA